jgi:hypothetical protein
VRAIFSAQPLQSDLLPLFGDEYPVESNGPSDAFGVTPAARDLFLCTQRVTGTASLLLGSSPPAAAAVAEQVASASVL